MKSPKLSNQESSRHERKKLVELLPNISVLILMIFLSNFPSISTNFPWYFEWNFPIFSKLRSRSINYLKVQRHRWAVIFIFPSFVIKLWFSPNLLMLFVTKEIKIHFTNKKDNKNCQHNNFIVGSWKFCFDTFYCSDRRCWLIRRSSSLIKVERILRTARVARSFEARLLIF